MSELKKMKMVKTVLMVLPFVTGVAVAEEKAKEKTEDADPTILLESTFVGDKEQPAISYFIPWKGNEAPDKLQWNLEPKHDQTLQLVDRDVLLNSMNIYNEMDLEGGVATD
jgi:hypothetical protein